MTNATLPGPMRPPAVRPLARFAMVAIGIAIVGVYAAFAVAHASYTLGCDYFTYDAAARRLLAGQAVYDLTATQTGQCGLFQYPPTFLLIVLPLTSLSPALALSTWIAVSLAVLFVAILVLPVRFEARAVLLVLAGTSWPFLYGLRIGQVEALLFLVFALGWRWIDRPLPLAATIAFGTLVKVQPVLLVAWAFLAGRRFVAWIAAAWIASIVALGALLDLHLWLDAATVIRTISGSAVTIAANVAPAAIGYQLGLSEPAAALVGVLHAIAVVVIAGVATRRASPEASFIAVVVASQLVSPIQWTHYALMLFLPIAWLVERRQWWALAAGLALNMMFVAWTPPVLYLLLADLLFVAVVWLGLSNDRHPAVLSTVPVGG